MRLALVAATLASTLTITAASFVTAQEDPILGERQWYISPLLSGVIDDEDRLSDPGLGGSIGFGVHFLPHWNVEFNVLGERLDGFNRVDQTGVGLDFIGLGDINARIVPYGLVGIDYLRTNVAEGGPNVPPSSARDDDNMAASIGLGIMTRLGSRALFRIEARERFEDAEPDTLADTIFNIGLVFPIGQVRHEEPPPAEAPPPQPPPKAEAPPPPPDSDGDGVPDNKDACPGTPPGARVDFRGCEIKEQIELPNVNFEFDSARLTADSSETLDGAVSTLERYPDLHVECAGHTDSIGSEQYNQNLSERRAHSVCEYLADHGIDRSRLTEHGYGESQPIADNKTEEGRARNRRVVLRITSGM